MSWWMDADFLISSVSQFGQAVAKIPFGLWSSVKQKSKMHFILFSRFFFCFFSGLRGMEGYGAKSQAVFWSVCVIFFGRFSGTRHQPASQCWLPKRCSLSKSLSCWRHFACVAVGLPAVKQQLSVSLSDSYSSEWKTMDLAQGACILCMRVCASVCVYVCVRVNWMRLCAARALVSWGDDYKLVCVIQVQSLFKERFHLTFTVLPHKSFAFKGHTVHIVRSFFFFLTWKSWLVHSHSHFNPWIFSSLFPTSC